MLDAKNFLICGFDYLCGDMYTIKMLCKYNLFQEIFDLSTEFAVKIFNTHAFKDSE